MDIYRKPNGKWQVRWREGARRCGRTFDRKGDALDYMGWLRRRQQLGQAWKESPLSDSNRRPLPYHGSALPAELRGRWAPA